MADKYIHLQNFKFGLDARRSELTSQPGTLVKCENAHINHGGEIEKRKGFYKNANTFPTNTFGLEVTSLGLITFGSDAAPNAALPNGVTYQRLQHPHAANMTSVTYSCNFQGSAFVVAKFSDGVSLCFYGGALVEESQNGKVLPGWNSAQQFAIDLARMISTIPEWASTANVDENGNTVLGSVIGKSPKGVYFTPVPGESSVSGTVGVQKLDVDYAGVAAKSAVAAFAVVNGTNGTWALTAPLHSDGSGVANISGTVNRQTTAALSAAAISTAINATTILYGYTSTVDGTGNVFVAAPSSWGALANGFTLTIVTTGDVGSGTSTASDSLSGTVTPNPDLVTRVSSTPFLNVYSDLVSCVPKGGTSPYTFVWAESTTGSGNGITITTPTGSSTKFFKGLITNQGVSGLFKVTITDSASPTPATKVIDSIYIELTHETNN